MSSWGQGGSRNWRKVRQEVLERDHFECQLRYDVCIFTATEVDHLAGISASGMARRAAEGEDAVSVCIAVCKPCHQKKTARQSRVAQAQLNATRAARRKLPQMPHPGER